MSSRSWARAALSHAAFIGISRHHLGCVVAELAGPWQARRESDLRERRGRGRLRAAGAGLGRDVVFIDPVLVTLAVLRLQIPHAALAVMYGVHRSTVTRAVRQVRPLLAGRGYATPAGPRLHTLADVFAYAAARGIGLRLDGSEVQARRPKAGLPGRRAFVSGEKKQNTQQRRCGRPARRRTSMYGGFCDRVQAGLFCWYSGTQRQRISSTCCPPAERSCKTVCLLQCPRVLRSAGRLAGRAWR